jgi:hypothetical protein
LKFPRTGEDVEVGEAVDEVATFNVAEDVTETVVASAEVGTDSVTDRLVG